MADQVSAHLEWRAGMSFDAVSGSGHTFTLDSVSAPGHIGPSPLELLVAGLGGCTAMDVVAILARMRQEIAGLAVEVTAVRAPSHPRHFTAVEIVYTVRGTDVDRTKVERAVELSQTTYCAAVASLRPDCTITHRIEITAN